MLQRVDELYNLIQPLRRFNHQTPANELPANGVYLFFEEGEVVDWRGRQVNRIVRVGTHNIDGIFRKRIRQHYGRVSSLSGNKNGSIFRKHVGGALLRRSDPSDPRLSIWLAQSGSSDQEIEAQVSRELRSHFTFCCIRVEGKEERLRFEASLIGLLAQFPLGRSSGKWLGRYAVSPIIGSCGLWNIQRTSSQPISSQDMLQLGVLVEATIAGYWLGSNDDGERSL